MKVICGLIFNSKKQLLITQRSKGEYKGKWEFPGGKLEKNENMEDCLKREILEELDIQIDIKSIFMINEYDYPTFSVELISYVCKYNDGKIKLIDHDRYEWIDINRLNEFDFLDGDKPIIDKIKKIGVTKMFQIPPSITVE